MLPDDVNKTLADKESSCKLDIQPKGYKYSGGRIEWHFENWEPSDNLRVNSIAFDGQRVLQIVQYFKDKPYDGDKRHYSMVDVEYMNVWGDRISLHAQK